VSERAAKDAAYHALEEALGGYLEACDEPVSAMATVASFLREKLPYVLWAGFYLPRPDGSLRVGPYQGPPATVVLPPGKGVCGAAFARRETVVVPDVHAFPGHIACDCRSRSEIVVPLLRSGRALGVLDLDSSEPAAFDDIDRAHLEPLAARVAALFSR
jgi:L-methionine (R)-S-oxide reductase